MLDVNLIYWLNIRPFTMTFTVTFKWELSDRIVMTAIWRTVRHG
jgi:hypothetical protein